VKDHRLVFTASLQNSQCDVMGCIRFLELNVFVLNWSHSFTKCVCQLLRGTEMHDWVLCSK